MVERTDPRAARSAAAPASRRPARPLFVLGLALFAGRGLASLAGPGLVPPAGLLPPAAGWALGLFAALLLGAAGLVRRVRGSGRPRPSRLGAWGWAPLVVVLSWARAAQCGPGGTAWDAPPEAAEAEASASSGAPDAAEAADEAAVGGAFVGLERPALGAWRALGRRGLGWLEPLPGLRDPRGETAIAFGPGGGDLAFRSVLLPLGPAPRDGERVLVLSGEWIPWPRGPAAGPRARWSGFDGLLRVRPDALVRLAPSPPPGPRWAGGAPLAAARAAWVGGLERAREAIAARLGRAGLGARAGALARSLLIGDPSAWDAADLDLFRRTGTRHLLAVSGLHVGLVAWLVLAVLRGPRPGAGARGGRWIPLALVAALVLYAAITGAGAPVVRATLAAALAAWAGRVRSRATLAGSGAASGEPAGTTPVPRRADGLSLWGAALAAEGLVRPAGRLELGLLLSYAATLGLILGTRPIERVLVALGSALRPPRVSLAPRSAGPGLLLRGIAGRLLGLGRTAVAASAAASLATLPLAWTRLGEVGVVGVLATPLAIPLLGAAIALGWLAALGPLGSAVPVARALELAARALFGLLELADRLPGSPLPLPERPAWLVLLATTAAFGALAAAGRTRALARATARAGFALLLVPWTPAPRGVELVALDVGHGTCLVLRAPGLPLVVFDAGSRDRTALLDEALGPLLSRLEPAGIAAGGSHAHRDHAGALATLLERYPPVLLFGALPPGLGERFPHVPAIDLAQGRVELVPGGGAGAPVRLQLVRGSDAAGNEGSRTLVVLGPEGRLVLTGDAEGAGLLAALRAGWLAGEAPARLLLAPHHGSDTPLLGPLLAELRPREVWISTSRPSAIEAELLRRGVRCRTTAAEGPLALGLRPAPRPPARPAGERPGSSSVPAPPGRSPDGPPERAEPGFPKTGGPGPPSTDEPVPPRSP